MNTFENSGDLTGCEVITETGELLGWVKKTINSREDDAPTSLIISILSLLWLPKAFTGSYQLSTSEIISSGPDRLIVFEGAEHKLVGQTISWLERIGLVKPPWRQKYQAANSSVYGDSWDDDDDSSGPSPIPAPRKPGPSPIQGEAKAPQG